MKIKKLFGVLAIFSILVLSGCNSNTNLKDYNPYYENINNNSEEDKNQGEFIEAINLKKDILDEFQIDSSEGEYSVSKDLNEETVYTLTKSGTYEIKGLLMGRIYIDNPNLDININLSGVKIVSTTNSPIFAKAIKCLTIKSVEGTYNEIRDSRDPKIKDTLNDGEAAIYSKGDLKLSGKGALYLYGNYNNGVATTDDLYIKNVILESVARNNSIKGNDSVTIESGYVFGISITGDGIKTDNSDMSNKENQHGSVNILGGMVMLYAWGDGIDSVFDVNIETTSKLTILSSPISKTFYVEVPERTIKNYYFIKTKNDNYRLSLYDDSLNEFNDAIFLYSKKNIRTGELEYYYQVKNLGSNNKTLYMFEKNKENSLTEYYACRNITHDIVVDLIEIDSVKDSKIDLDYSVYSFSNQVFDGIKKEKELSKKGIKANNIIKINGGNIQINAYDDAIHAGSDSLIESTSKNGKGDIIINGGYITLRSHDDAIHADGILTINYGNIDIKDYFEGIEGNIININNGNINIKSLYDDGINAKGLKYNPLVNIIGGNISVEAMGDAIDSNGDYLQDGGNVNLITISNGKCLDYEGKCEIKSGSLICNGETYDIIS